MGYDAYLLGASVFKHSFHKFPYLMDVFLFKFVRRLMWNISVPPL